MSSSLREYFKGEGSLLLDKDGNPISEQLRLAVGVVLLESAGRDGDYAPQEVKAAFAAMSEQFHMSKEEVHALLEEGDELRINRQKVDRLIRLIISEFSKPQRLSVLAMAWLVFLADEDLEKLERRFAEDLRVRFGLSQEEERLARRMARSEKEFTSQASGRKLAL